MKNRRRAKENQRQRAAPQSQPATPISPPTSPEEKLLSRKYIFTAIWATGLAVLSFIGGKMYEVWNGPTQVQLARGQFSKDPVHVVVQESAETLQRLRRIEQIESDLQTLKSRIQGKVNDRAPTAASQEVSKLAKELQVQIEALKRERLAMSGENSSKARGARTPIPGAASSPGAQEKDEFGGRRVNTKVNYDKAAYIKAYYLHSMDGAKNASCPPDRMRQGEIGLIGFVFTDEKRQTLATPLFLKINLVRAERDLLQKLDANYELRLGENYIPVRMTYGPGKYGVSIGYFLLGDLEKETAQFYSHSCVVTVE